MTDLITPGQERYLAKQRARAVAAGRGEKPKGFTETANQRLARMQKEAEAEKINKQAIEALQKANTFAATLREREAAAAAASAEREAQSKASNEYMISKTILSTPPRSQTIVQRAIEQQQKEEQQKGYSEEKVFPVATSKQGGTLYRTKEGTIYRDTASSVKGGNILTPVQEEVKTSAKVLPEKQGEGFATPLFALSPERRRDIIKAGEKLQEEANKPGLLGVQRSELGGKLRSTIGANLEELGYNPKGYVLENVVLPTQAGAAVGAGTNIFIGGTEKVLGKTAANVADKALFGAGAVSVVTTVSTRTPAQQRPDIVFGILGVKAGAAKPDLIPVKDPEFYAGQYVPGARSKQLRTANRPTSKAELRKQSFNQQYNPNVYRTGGAVVERTPRSIRALEILGQGKLRATEAKIAKTGEGTVVAARSTYINTQDNSPFVNEPNRVVAVLPKGGREQVSVKFTQGSKPTDVPLSGNVQRKEYSGDIKSNSLYSRPGSQVKLPSNVQDVVLQTKVIPNAITKNVGRDPVFKSDFVSGTPKGDVGSPIPEYELVPNRPPNAFSTYAVTGTQRGGFRYRKSGERILQFRPDVQLPVKNDIVVTTYYEPVVTPSKDIALNRDFSSGTIKLSNTAKYPNTFLAANYKADLLSAPKSSSIVDIASAQNNKFAFKPLISSDNKIKSNNIISLKLSEGYNQKQQQIPITEQIQSQDQIQDQTFVPARFKQAITVTPSIPSINNTNQQLKEPTPTRRTGIARPRDNKPLRQEEPIVIPEETTGIPGTTKKGKKKRGVLGFDVFVKTKGEFLKANPLSLSEEQAFNLGASRVAKTSSASFKVVPSGTEAIGRFDLRVDKEQFRQSKRTPGVVVEKSRYRINTPGELREITFKGIATKRRGLL